MGRSAGAWRWRFQYGSNMKGLDLTLNMKGLCSSDGDAFKAYRTLPKWKDRQGSWARLRPSGAWSCLTYEKRATMQSALLLITKLGHLRRSCKYSKDPTRHPDPCLRQYTTRQHETWYVCPETQMPRGRGIRRIFTETGRCSTDLS